MESEAVAAERCGRYSPRCGCAYRPVGVGAGLWALWIPMSCAVCNIDMVCGVLCAGCDVRWVVCGAGGVIRDLCTGSVFCMFIQIALLFA